MFARDTGGCLISRLGLARSSDEKREISIAEISESVLFYFSAPALARVNSRLFSRIYDIDKNQLRESVKDLKNVNNNDLQKIKSAKLGQILATFGIILPLVFAIAPIRNNVTLSKDGKDEFVSVVGLKKDKKDRKEKEAKEKTTGLIKKLALVSLSSLAATAGILGFLKNKKNFEKVQGLTDKFIKKFEFTKDCDLETIHYGALIYPVSIASYFWASRDKYEFKENARRFSVTVPLLFFGEKLIQNPIYKYFDKKFKTDVFNGGNILTYKDIEKLPQDKINPFLKTKNRAYGATFFINTMLIAAAVALLNRIKTKRDYNKDNPSKANSNFKLLKHNIDDFMLKCKK